MTPEQRKQIEIQIQNDFVELQKKLVALKAEIQNEADEAKKQEKNEEINRLESEAAELKTKIDTLKLLNEQELESLKTRLESFKAAIHNFRGEVIDLQNEKMPTPTTYELLKDSATIKGFEGDLNHPGLLKIIESNPNEFRNLPGDTAEKKLEYMFKKIRNGIVLFLKNKLGDSSNNEKVINETIAPALERSFIEMLRDQGNEANIKMFEGIKSISLRSFGKLFTGVTKFAATTAGSYNKFNQRMNAIDYLSVYNGVLNNPESSAVLTSPVEFKKYLNDDNFRSTSFSPYHKIDKNIFKISDEETFEFGMSLQEKQDLLTGIGQIEVVNSPKTTALIAKMIDKPEQFLKKTEGLQQTANGLLDNVASLNSVTKMFGVDILKEVTKVPEKRSFLYRIMDFVCKLIGITGGLEGIVKRWRLDRMNLSDAKNDDISKIFKQYKELAGEKVDLKIIDENSCKTALKAFEVTENNESSTKGDYLRDSIAENMDVSLVSPAVVQQILGDSYLKKETIKEKGKTKEIFVVDTSKFTESDKLKLAHNHLVNMKSYLEIYKDNQRDIDLSDFYTSITSTEDIALCITASLYADKDDVIEGVKAKVFLPENYGVVRMDGTVDNGVEGGNESVSTPLSELTPDEQTEMQSLVEQSKAPNTINYLENNTYKKYLNMIENNLNLPKYSLECVCSQESAGRLYSGSNIIGSRAGAQGLFQFMPGTADQYMKHTKLQEKYGKTFSSRDEFLKDPLATAWAAGIIYSQYMHDYNYNFQSSLACYNRGIGNYQRNIGNRNLTSEDMQNLPRETQAYVENITQKVLEHNSATIGTETLLADLGQYLWNGNGGSQTLA